MSPISDGLKMIVSAIILLLLVGYCDCLHEKLNEYKMPSQIYEQRKAQLRYLILFCDEMLR